ncbi:MAG: undecaprenyl/decaprenyl-phosphate alpha-N-acetylglucosaminyl 1-phosphate transferase [Flavobacteriales bacterium]|nr:undecaprenyl/decaprenyl-phosphate alpha-N-acetylglucosaminyl 1-phosphate transferase [Flavobacteriales bacterium]MCB9194468.1 undecaprenyl/decaprenyl-phosphate alpha-N-acetylglucosaminyl 1-phosphate transferase [Flavobacteriales bacterium]
MYSGTQLFLIYSGLFFAAVMFSLLINSLFMRFSRTLGSREPDAALIRWSASHKPAFGGIAFFIVFLGAFAVNGAFFPKNSAAWQPELFGLIAATCVGFLVGLADDAYNTRPLLKLFAQIVCALVLILSGTYIRIFDTLWVDQLITVVWVVGIMNAINMLDNMDAISTVVSIMILVGALTVHLVNGAMESIQVVLLVGTIAALCGFLFYNWNPSRMFMGDTGSQFLGVYLAYVGIVYFWNGQAASGAHEPWRQAVSALIMFILPIVDTTTVTINRIMKGGSPFVGGRDHTTHHLSYAGLSDGQVALTFAALGAVSVFLNFVQLRFIPAWNNLYTALFVLYALLLFGILFGMTHRKGRSKNDA